MALSPWALTALGLAVFLQRARAGLWFLPFADESMALLGGRVLNAGGVLYRDFIDDHGPLLFLLTSAYGRWVGWANPNSARLIPVGMMVLAAAALAASPALSGRASRLWATGLFLGLIASTWLFQGLYLINYYTLGGALSVVQWALFAFPVVLRREVRPASAFWAGLAGACSAFCCYCFMPSVILFASAGVCRALGDRRFWRPVAWFVGTGFAAYGLLLGWISVFGDLRGYFAFHIAFSQTAYRPFILFGWGTFLHSLRPSLAPDHRIQTLALVAWAVGGAWVVSAAARTDSRRAGVAAGVLALAGVMMLNARGSNTFHDGPFLMAAFAGLSLACVDMLDRWAAAHRPRGRLGVTLVLVGVLVLTEGVVRGAVATPNVVDWNAMVEQPRYDIGRRAETPIAVRIREIVRPDERFLALVYQPDLYFAADRLPISGFYTYLPWDAAYARAPWFGRPRDLCVALEAEPPPLIAFDGWRVWNAFDLGDYAPCVPKILAERYRRLKDLPDLYVRRDRYQAL